MSELTKNLAKLKTWRDLNDRKSRETIEIWNNSIVDNLKKLGKDRPLILEQTCIAALDCRLWNIALACIELLYRDFPNSLRVKKYEAMYLEAQEEYDKALIVLNNIIKVDETNSAARKRKITILKAQGKNIEAIKELTEYLKTFMADTEAWQELSELYINEQDYSKAAFCVEELILHNPHNHLLYQRYADIKYTHGGLENIELAKAYYCQAIHLNPKNIRALYGLYLTLTAIANSQKSSAQRKKDLGKLIDWVLTKIKDSYTKHDVSNLNECLAALQI